CAADPGPFQSPPAALVGWHLGAPPSPIQLRADQRVVCQSQTWTSPYPTCPLGKWTCSNLMPQWTFLTELATSPGCLTDGGASRLAAEAVKAGLRPMSPPADALPLSGIVVPKAAAASARAT